MLAVSALALYVSTQGATGQSQSLDQGFRPSFATERLVAERLKRIPASGIVIGRIQNGKQGVWSTGVLSIQQQILPNADTLFEIGSLTKTFTALLLADAVSRSLVTLDDPLEVLLPGRHFSTSGGKPITLLHLATHTSGLPRLPATMPLTDSANPYAGFGPSQLLYAAEREAPAASPGDQYLYSNFGYGLLADALCARASVPFETLVRERITSPLGMADTGVMLGPSAQSRLAQGHDAAGQPAKAWDFSTMEGAGALRSSPRDMLTYLSAHLRPKGTGSPAGLDTVSIPRRPIDALGRWIGLAWHIQPLPNGNVIWHNGLTGGHAAFIGFSADRRSGVVVLANSSEPVDMIGFTELLAAVAQ